MDNEQGRMNMEREDRIWFDIREIAKDKAAHKRFKDAWYAAGFEENSLVADYIPLDDLS